MIHWWKIDIRNKKVLSNIKSSIQNQNISQGIITSKLEKQIAKALGVNYVVLTNSGTIALLMSMIVLKLKKGDEIILPNCGWISPVHAAILLGLKIKLVDVQQNSPVICMKSLKKAINKKTKAIIPIHLNGKYAETSEIKKIIKNKNIHIIEDSAQALFSKNKNVFIGTEGDIGCYSFSVSKIITTGQGGFCCTNSVRVYNQLKSLRTHGLKNIIDSPWNKFGFNFKFNDILASVAIDQIKNYQEIKKKLNNINKIYEEGISSKKIKFIKSNRRKGEIAIYNQILVKNKKSFILYLKKNNIEARPGYRRFDTIKYYNSIYKTNCSNSKNFDNLVILPSGPAQKIKNIKKVIEISNRY